MSRGQLISDTWRACDIVHRDNNCGGIVVYAEHLILVLFRRFVEENILSCASPYNLKDVLEIVDNIDFKNPDDIHTVSHVYEGLLQRLGNENKMAGEFYTPRPVIRFIVQVVNPVLGETVYDPACGSAGFLAEAYEHLRKAEKSRKDYEIL